MREHPISLNVEMVQAIFTCRKKQILRIINKLEGFGQISQFSKSETQGYDWAFRNKRMLWNDLRHSDLVKACPYGRVGDRLWVREKWCQMWMRDSLGGTFVKARYFADGYIPQPGMFFLEPEAMPRWASRITLEITNIRIEALNGISDADALTEDIDREQNPWVWVIDFKRI